METILPKLELLPRPAMDRGVTLCLSRISLNRSPQVSLKLFFGIVPFSPELPVKLSLLLCNPSPQKVFRGDKKLCFTARLKRFLFGSP